MWNMLCSFLDMAARNPLLGGVLLTVPGGRIRLGAVQHTCTVISPAVDPEHLVPWVDIETSLLAGRRMERPGLLQRQEHRLLVLQRAHDLSALAAQHIVRWLEATVSAQRPPVLAVVDDMSGHVPHWLDCRLAFRLHWNDTSEPEITELPWSSAPPYDTEKPDETLLRTIAEAAAARGLNDPRYDIMTAAAACTRAAFAKRPVAQEDVAWAIRCVLDSRTPRPQNQAVQATSAGNTQTVAVSTVPAAEDGAAANATESFGNAAAQSTDSSDSHPRDDTSQAVSPSGSRAGNTVQFAPIAAASDAEQLMPDAFPPSQPAGSTAAGHTAGRYGRALPGSAGRLGRKSGDRAANARIDVAATLRAAAPWQRLRKADDRRELPRRGIRVYPEDLTYRRRERRPGSTYFILLDASASMWTRQVARAKRIALQLIERAYRSRSRIAVIAVRGTEPELLVPPGRCYDLAHAKILSLEAGGSTPLVPALHLTASLLTASPSGGSAFVYILTDGRGTASSPATPSSDAAMRSIGQALMHSRAQITVIGVAPLGRDRAARRLAHALHGSYQST